MWKSSVGKAPEYSLEPEPPTTLVNRPGYRGPLKTPRRRFTIYELQMLASKGDEDYDKYKVSTTFHDESEEEEEVEKPKKVYKPNIKSLTLLIKIPFNEGKSRQELSMKVTW